MQWIRLQRRGNAQTPLVAGCAGALLLLFFAAGCGAPASKPIEGEIATAVERSIEGGSEAFDHSIWDRLLAEGTKDGLADYRYFQKNRADLDAYLDSIARADLGSLAPDELHALLINAYNALTVRVILDHSTVQSIREINGVWTKLKHSVGGHEVTLDEIEHNIIRPFFRDPRIHFAVNCASYSCAPLTSWAFTGQRLNEQLEEVTRAFLGNEANVRIENGTLYLSQYFDWYGDDFVSEGWEPRAESIEEFVALYASPEAAEAIRRQGDRLRTRFLDYDWSLNAATPPDPALNY